MSRTDHDEAEIECHGPHVHFRREAISQERLRVRAAERDRNFRMSFGEGPDHRAGSRRVAIAMRRHVPDQGSVQRV